MSMCPVVPEIGASEKQDQARRLLLLWIWLPVSYIYLHRLSYTRVRPARIAEVQGS